MASQESQIDEKELDKLLPDQAVEPIQKAEPKIKVEEKPKDVQPKLAKVESTFESIKNEIESQIQDRVHVKANADGLRWDHTPLEIRDLSNQIIKKANASVNEVVAFKGKRTFENTILAIDNIQYQLEFDSTPLVFYQSVATTKERREAAKFSDKTVGDYNTDLWMRDDVYNLYKEYKANAVKDGSYAKLDAETKRYVD